MKIIQISAVREEGYDEATIYGLGDDGKLYYWGEVEEKPGIREKIQGIISEEEYRAKDKPTTHWWKQSGIE